MDNSFFLLMLVTGLFVPIILVTVFFLMLTLSGGNVKEFVKYALKSEEED